MIYFVRAAGTDFVKIGYTQDQASLKGRLQALQTGRPWRLDVLRTIDPADRWVEGWLHEVYAAQRHQGEWFTYSHDMMTISIDKRALSRWTPCVQTRKALGDMIERLIDLLDRCEPEVDLEDDIDRETEEDWEDGGDHEADDDLEQSAVEVEVYEDYVTP